MAEVMVQKAEDLRKEMMTAGDLARQVEELKRQVENIKPGAEDRSFHHRLQRDLDKVLAALSLPRVLWPWAWRP
jgi:hypothetical protein